MAWDFSTEPEFERKLEWMRQFVRDEIFPLETLDLTHETLDRGHQAAAGGGQGARACGPPTCHPSSGAAGSARSSWA